MSAPRRVVVLGATSAIGEATARLFAAEGAALVIAGRDAARLDAIAADLTGRGAASVHVAVLDLAEPGDAVATMEGWAATLGGLDAVLLFYGVLGDQMRAETDLAEARRVLRTNFLSAADWCLAAATVLERQRRGSLVVVGSVAGDRGRRSNYIYGAAKGGLERLVQGLAHRLAASGARAVIVKPGFVDTPMTADMRKGGPLWATPARVAAIVHRAAGRGGSTVYAPGFWRWIMLVIRLLPTAVLHRTRL
jgi:NAD(P)-dependent dehydrogenase (short-subunit alcohol dehydrogenase family)